MFKRPSIGVISFIAGSVVMFVFLKFTGSFLWFRPSLATTSMCLIAKGGPFKIYSSPGTGWKDFAVFRGNECLVLSEVISASSNSYEITHFENGFGILCSVYRSGCLEKRDYTWDKSQGSSKYVYFDTNADGIWNILCDVENKKKYEWYNDGWVRIGE